MRDIGKKVVARSLTTPEMRASRIARSTLVLQKIILLEFQDDHMPILAFTGLAGQVNRMARHVT